MSVSNIISIIPISVLLIVLSLFLLTGRGSFLIAGFNTMSKDRKAKYDSGALSKFFGKILLPMGLLLPFFVIDNIISWFVWVYCVVSFTLAIFAIIYVHKSKRFRK